MKKYFVYELKKSLFAICTIALIMTAITVTAVLADDYSGTWKGESTQSGIAATAMMSGILALAVPIWMLSYKMHKRSADLYYSLPIKRRQVLGVKYLVGLVAVFAPFTVAFFAGAVAAVIRFPSDALAGGYYFPAYFALLPTIYCLYSIMSFVFTRADRVIDGIVFMAFWMFALFAVAGVVQRFVYGVAADMFMPTAPLNSAAYYFMELIEDPTAPVVYDSWNIQISRAVGFTLTGLQAVAATVMLFVTERTAKVENIGGVSGSPFGYKVMIPLLTVCVLIILDIVNNTVLVYLDVIVASVAFMLTALYRHTFRIGKVQTAILIGSIALGIALSVATGYIVG